MSEGCVARCRRRMRLGSGCLLRAPRLVAALIYYTDTRNCCAKQPQRLERMEKLLTKIAAGDKGSRTLGVNLHGAKIETCRSSAGALLLVLLLFFLLLLLRLFLPMSVLISPFGEGPSQWTSCHNITYTSSYPAFLVRGKPLLVRNVSPSVIVFSFFA